VRNSDAWNAVLDDWVNELRERPLHAKSRDMLGSIVEAYLVQRLKAIKQDVVKKKVLCPREVFGSPLENRGGRCMEN